NISPAAAQGVNISWFENISAKVDKYRPTSVIKEWNYDLKSPLGPLYWYRQFPECGWRKQSPVDIDLATGQKSFVCDVPLQLKVQGYETRVYGEFLNNGVQIFFANEDEKLRVEGSFVEGPFVLEKIFFHWGNSSLEGSEHSMGGKRFP